MTHWIVPSNNSHFRLDDYLRDFNEIVWIHRSNFKVGDIIYIYATEPLKRLTYIMEVIKTNVSQKEYETKYNDSAYSNNSNKVSQSNKRRSLFKLVIRIPLQTNLTLKDLRKHGCTASMQSSIKVHEQLLNYIQNELSNQKPTTTWVIISNNDFYRLDDLLKRQDIIAWRQRSDFEKGDTIYVYTTKPTARITYKMLCTEANLPTSKYVDDEEYWMDESIDKKHLTNYGRYAHFKLVERLPNLPELSYDVLKNHGLKTVQRTHRMRAELLEFIESVLKHKNCNNNCEVDYPVDNTAFFEGAVMKVLVNKYERNIKARKECIAKLGCKCVICGCDFAHRYGKLGEGFIHVHHIVPIGSIGKEYVLDPVKDLVPVCPNCHYMLHRTNPPMSPESLRMIMNSKSKKTYN